jgi:hypothetical protein
MKLCTIAYDGETPTYLPHQRAKALTDPTLYGDHVRDIMLAVEFIAAQEKIDPDTLLWDTQIHYNPTSLCVACPDELESALRLRLPDEFLIEVDPAPCDRIIDRAAHPHP